MIPLGFWAAPITNLPFAQWRIGKRKGTQYITVHYNGPPVPGAGKPNAERDQLRFDARYHMQPHVLKADGIQYHIAILSNGDRVLLRPLDDLLWHCGNARGNAYSIAIHIPIGGNQRMTAAQYSALFQTIDILRKEYNIHVTNVKPHNEWKSTFCPGIPIFDALMHYRNAQMHGTPFVRYVTKINANVRALPDVRSNIQYMYAAGTIFCVNRIIENGVPFNGNPAYVKLTDNTGYIHLSIVRPV